MNDPLEEVKAQFAKYRSAAGRGEHVFPIKPGAAALLVVDMQRFVCAPSDGRHLPGMERIVSTINEMADGCRRHGVPVIWLRHSFNTTKSSDDAGLYRAFHKAPLSPRMFDQGPDTEIFEGMHFDGARDHVVFKNRYSAFAKGASSLDEVLARLGVRQLWVAGVATNVCVESTARDAMQLDYEVVMVEDAMIAAFELVHQVLLMNFRAFYGDVRRAEEILAQLPEVGALS